MASKLSGVNATKIKFILFFCIVSYFIVLYFILSYCFVLYCIVLFFYCIVLYCMQSSTLHYHQDLEVASEYEVVVPVSQLLQDLKITNHVEVGSRTGQWGHGGYITIQ